MDTAYHANHGWIWHAVDFMVGATESQGWPMPLPLGFFIITDVNIQGIDEIGECA